MLAWFAYSASPSVIAIALDLSWGPAGERLGRINVSPGLEKAMQLAGYPVSFAAMELESALPYAVFLAIRAQRPLTVTGDPAVWNPAWGALHGEESFALAATPTRMSAGATPIVGPSSAWLRARFGLDGGPPSA